MSTQNTFQNVLNQFPNAAVFFIKLGNDGLPLKDYSQVQMPDIGDILDIQCSLGSTGTTGKFLLKINNDGSKYFVKDDIEGEIASMNSGNPTVVIDQLTGLLEKKLDPLSYKAASTVWKDANDFLNRREYNKFYNKDSASSVKSGQFFTKGQADYVYLLFDTVDDKGQPVLGYRKLPNNVAMSADVSGGGLTQNGLKLETVVLSKEESDQIKAGGMPNFAFYEKLGGQQEHGRCMFEPMQLCLILLPPRFTNSKAADELTVAFTGLVDNVSDEFEGSRNIITIRGSDITKWLRVTSSNVNPALIEAGLPQAGTYKIFGNIFSGLLGWQIIQLLCMGGKDSEGNKVYGAGNFQFTQMVGNDLRHANDLAQNSGRGKMGSKNFYSYSELANTLRIQKANVDGEKTDATTVVGTPISSAATDATQLLFSSSQVHLQILPWDSSPSGTYGENSQNLGVYKKVFGNSFSNWQNEYVPAFDIANEVANLTNYEFYADQVGDIYYHQPRYNNYHILSLDTPEVYTLNDDDIISHQFTESDEQVVTSVYCVGQYDYITATPQLLKYTGFYEDPSLVRRYGRRMVNVSHPYVMTAPDCLLYAKSYLIRINAARFTGTVTLVGRPELRMHMPVFVPTRNMVYYIVGISHNFSYGERFTTQVKLAFGRKPWEYISEVLDYNVMPNLDSKIVYTNSKTQTMLDQEARERADSVSQSKKMFYDAYDQAKVDDENIQRSQGKFNIVPLSWEKFKADANNGVPDFIDPPPEPTDDSSSTAVR